MITAKKARRMSCGIEVKDTVELKIILAIRNGHRSIVFYGMISDKIISKLFKKGFEIVIRRDFEEIHSRVGGWDLIDLMPITTTISW